MQQTVVTSGSTATVTTKTGDHSTTITSGSVPSSGSAVKLEQLCPATTNNTTTPAQVITVVAPTQTTQAHGTVHNHHHHHHQRFNQIYY